MDTHTLAKAGQILARSIATRAAALWLACLSVTIFVAASWWLNKGSHAPLLLAPMMDLTPCLLARPVESTSINADWLAKCAGTNASSAHLVESTLRHLQPEPHGSEAWELGYTLQIPLLALLQADKNAWQVNLQAIHNILNTLRDSPRPVVLYLFSTHFSVNAPIEQVLAQNPDNIAHTPLGPLPIDNYYGQPVYPWSVSRTDNPVTQYRVEVIRNLLQGL